MNIDPYQFVRIAEDLEIENRDMDFRHKQEKELHAVRVLKFLAIIKKVEGLALRQKHELRDYLPKGETSIQQREDSLIEKLSKAGEEPV